ncbi:putative integral membrane protein [Podospora appendiculata]|uniref:Integral membrane protein n=1 Tax=Podospora appendiculata TaxID=314037 RepID=A0AAE0XIT1_9PEZI|nr:putative integral membrane protein [Podospora appendiculata]
MWYLGNAPVVERSHGLVFSAFFFTILSFIVVSMRIYTRVGLLGNLGTDDVLICIALVGSISYMAAAMEQVRYGLGDAVRFEEIENFLTALYVTVVSYSFTQMAVKFSILFQYRRIFQTPLAKRITVGLLVWFTAYGSVCLGTSIFTCWPIPKYWRDSIPGGCIDRSVLHYFLAAFNILNDFMLLFFPMPFLKKLQVNSRVRAVLIAVFACGAFACIVSIIRLRSLYVNNSAPVVEQPVYGVDIALWSCLEINIAIVCASVPSLKALFVKIIPQLNSSAGGGSKPTGYGRGRNTGGSVPLQSFDHRETATATGPGATSAGGDSASSSDLEKGKMEIQVHQTFEMRTSNPAQDDDGSEKDLVTRSWVAADQIFPGGARVEQNGKRAQEGGGLPMHSNSVAGRKGSVM